MAADSTDQPRHTQAQIAAHLDMSERNLRDVLIKIKMDHRKHTLDEIRVGYIRYMRDLAGNRGGDEAGNLARARIRESAANAQLKELQFNRDVGLLVPVQELEPLLTSWASAGRVEILAAFQSFAAGITSQHGIEITQDDINDAASAACRIIADYPRDFVGADDAGGRKVEAAAGM